MCRQIYFFSVQNHARGGLTAAIYGSGVTPQEECPLQDKFLAMSLWDKVLRSHVFALFYFIRMIYAHDRPIHNLGDGKSSFCIKLFETCCTFVCWPKISLHGNEWTITWSRESPQSSKSAAADGICQNAHTSAWLQRLQRYNEMQNSDRLRGRHQHFSHVCLSVCLSVCLWCSHSALVDNDWPQYVQHAPIVNTHGLEGWSPQTES